MTDQNAKLREIETKVLDLVVAGKSNKEIAAAMNCSIRTIEGRRSRIMRKLAVPNVAALVKKAFSSDFREKSLKVARVPKTAEPLNIIEQKVLKMVLQGMPSREIALKMNRSIRTIEENRRRIKLKIGADDVISLVKSSIKMNLVDI